MGEVVKTIVGMNQQVGGSNPSAGSIIDAILAVFYYFCR